MKTGWRTQGPIHLAPRHVTDREPSRRCDRVSFHLLFIPDSAGFSRSYFGNDRNTAVASKVKRSMVAQWIAALPVGEFLGFLG